MGGRGGSIDGIGGSLQPHTAQGQGQPGWKEAELSGSLERAASVQAPVTFLVVAVMVIPCMSAPWEYADPGEPWHGMATSVVKGNLRSGTPRARAVPIRAGSQEEWAPLYVVQLHVCIN